MARVLVVEDEEGVRSFLVEAMDMFGHDVTEAEDGEQGIRALRKAVFDVCLTDLKMPKVDGLSLLRVARAEAPEMQVIVMTAHGTVDTAVEAMKLGAFDYLQKPISGLDELRLLVDRAAERKRLLALKDRKDLEQERLDPLSYGDPAMGPVVEALRKVAPTNASVLLLGESGTGKELAARQLHQWSPRRGGPFVAVNCAALSETLLLSELFGHEKGAFTGANARRRGRIELAHEGTFFLDEIGELKPEMQAKLLRVIELRRFERLGGSQTISVDVRWVAATNRDLAKMVEVGEFREDLYHRLAVFPVRLPPLRDRPQDILPLAARLLERVAADLGRSGTTLDESAREFLRNGVWTGNVRELRNALERAAILADGITLRAEHFTMANAPSASSARTPLLTLEEMEKSAIARALATVDGNRRQAAERLGIGLRTLYDKIKRYHL